jgi:hypothetical protein
MTTRSPNRKLRIGQDAVDGFRQVMEDAENRYSPVLDHVNSELGLLRTTVDEIFVLGLAHVIGADPYVLGAPVTSQNWLARLRACRACSKLTSRENYEREYLLCRDMLTPEEFTRVRKLIEKLEQHQRQGVFDLDELDDDVPF